MKDIFNFDGSPGNGANAYLAGYTQYLKMTFRPLAEAAEMPIATMNKYVPLKPNGKPPKPITITDGKWIADHLNDQKKVTTVLGKNRRWKALKDKPEYKPFAEGEERDYWEYLVLLGNTSHQRMKNLLKERVLFLQAANRASRKAVTRSNFDAFLHDWFAPIIPEFLRIRDLKWDQKDPGAKVNDETAGEIGEAIRPPVAVSTAERKEKVKAAIVRLLQRGLLLQDEQGNLKPPADEIKAGENPLTWDDQEIVAFYRKSFQNASEIYGKYANNQVFFDCQFVPVNEQAMAKIKGMLKNVLGDLEHVRPEKNTATADLKVWNILTCAFPCTDPVSR